jgi:hypothetical protein
MKRAMGLILAVLSFGVVAHADRMEYSGTDYAGGAGTGLRSDATVTEALDGSYDLIEPGSIALRAGRSLAESGDGERLTDYVLYSLPAQPVDATPSSALIRQCFRERTSSLASFGQNLAWAAFLLV